MSLATLALSLVSTKYRRESTEKKNRGMGEKKEREMSNAGVYHRHLWCVQTKKAMYHRHLWCVQTKKAIRLRVKEKER